MLPAPLVIAVSLACVGLLFAIAYYGDRRAQAGRSLVRNPVVYTLSIAVYCTSWTFYGAVGTAARSGLEFITIYLGPTIVFLGWWFVLRKILRISKAHRITSIADFIASRYGKSTQLSMLVTLIAVIGTTPYIALQLKAVATSFTVLTDLPAGADSGHGLLADTAFWVAALMALFGILFGTRHIDANEHHEGVVAAIAFESLLKLLALLSVGLFVTFGVFAGFPDLFAEAARLPEARQLFTLDPEGGGRWLTLTLLSMAAVLTLPRQFHVTVVENVDERHLATAGWLFPAYLLAMTLFVLPIALTGMLRLPGEADPDFFVLTVPLAFDHELLALIAYIGGLSSATGMVVVAAIALSTMVCNDLVVPLLLRLVGPGLAGRGDLTGILLGIRRLSVVLILGLGYAYYRLAGESDALASIGLTSFAAAAQLLPAMLGGLWWAGGTRRGALAGLAAGFAMWAYTLIVPTFARADWLDPMILFDGPFDLAWLRPEALFGLSGMDPLSHALLWSMLVNIGAYVLVSLFSPQGALERIQAVLFTDVFGRTGGGDTPLWTGSRATGADLFDLAIRFLGRERAQGAFAAYERARGLNWRRIKAADPDLLAFVERLLAGSVGAASARVLVGSVAQGEPVGLDEVMAILTETSHVIEYSQRLEEKSRQLETAAAELKAANDRLKELDRLKDDFLSVVSHEFRTPLTSIRSFSEILVDNPDMPRPQAERFMSIMVSESQRLTRLIDEHLDLAQLEAGRGEWHLSEIDPGEVIADAVAATQGVFQARRAQVEVTLEPARAAFRLDRDRLMQVVINLLSNAAKFADPEQPRIVVSGGPAAGGGFAVSVTDNGPGVPEADHEMIFDKFARAGGEAPNRPTGSGLGLAISRQVMSHFGGRIWVENTAQGGARFHLWLPASR
ncbi:sensor histidine kinase [Roseospirillum parvum]|uniref:histidine kinase n=1 Tax=Roseospirillum parvum TaxID=83401 RepID=A0A1G7WT68_9PROT|nr:sensor histidine kinase [Roseospirillum parvum]SDG75094.1 hypothetical protein SAMN05421742_102311 [Roseospirillum parvum]